MSTDAALSNSASNDVKQNNTVLFPPRELADFVVHYDNTEFHVHRTILHHLSGYFNEYFQLLTAPQDSSTSATRKRARPSSPSSSTEEKQHRDYRTITHCIHVPLQTRSVEQTPVTAADFRLFLYHLYFSQHYCCPPYLPKTDIDLNDPPPLSHTLPPITAYTTSSIGPGEAAVYSAVSLPVNTENVPLRLAMPDIISVDWSDDSNYLRRKI